MRGGSGNRACAELQVLRREANVPAEPQAVPHISVDHAAENRPLETLLARHSGFLGWQKTPQSRHYTILFARSITYSNDILRWSAATDSSSNPMRFN
jgi:hypothetical protein